MAKNNIRVKKVPINLDKKRHLLYDLNAFCEFEDAYGKFAAEGLDDMEKGSMKATRLLLWSGLVHEDEDLTVKEVGKMISLEKLVEIRAKIIEAFSNSEPVADENSEGEEKN